MLGKSLGGAAKLAEAVTKINSLTVDVAGLKKEVAEVESVMKSELRRMDDRLDDIASKMDKVLKTVQKDDATKKTEVLYMSEDRLDTETKLLDLVLGLSYEDVRRLIKDKSPKMFRPCNNFKIFGGDGNVFNDGSRVSIVDIDRGLVVEFST